VTYRRELSGISEVKVN